MTTENKPSIPETPITASFTHGGKKYDNVPVINPGDWYGKTWCIWISGGFESDPFIVEADNCSDAVDEFVDSKEGHRVHIEEHEMGDYGYKAHAGDVFGGIDIEEDCWVNLKGEIIRDEDGEIITDENHPKVKYLQEPSTAGNAGTPYDDDHMTIDGQEGSGVPFECLYHHASFEGGMTPMEYQTLQNGGVELQRWVAEGNLHLGSQKDRIEIISDAYEAGLSMGDEKGWDRCAEFCDREYGYPGKLIKFIKEVADSTESTDFWTIKAEAQAFVNKAGCFRDPTCHIVRKEVDGRQAFLFRWVDLDSKKEVMAAVLSAVYGDRVRFTFERLIAERKLDLVEISTRNGPEVFEGESLTSTITVDRHSENERNRLLCGVDWMVSVQVDGRMAQVAIDALMLKGFVKGEPLSFTSELSLEGVEMIDHRDDGDRIVHVITGSFLGGFTKLEVKK